MNPLLLLGLLGGGAWWIASSGKKKSLTVDIMLQTPAALPKKPDPRPQLFAALFGACGAQAVASQLTNPAMGRYVYTVTLDRDCPLPAEKTVVALHFSRGVSIPATVLLAQRAPVAA